MAHPTKPIRDHDAANIEQLRALCLSLPEANERLSHGEPTWFAGKGKVFAMLDNHHHGAEHLAVWLPLPDGAQADLINAEPRRFFRPPYVGPSGWVGLVLDATTDWGQVTHLVREAFLHVAGVKLKAKLLSDQMPSDLREIEPPSPGRTRPQRGGSARERSRAPASPRSGRSR